MSNTPPPQEYALMSFEQRGCVIAALSVTEAKQYAIAYADYLNTLMDGTNNLTGPDEVFDKMMVCAIGWRGLHGREVAK